MDDGIVVRYFLAFWMVSLAAEIRWLFMVTLLTANRWALGYLCPHLELGAINAHPERCATLEDKPSLDLDIGRDGLVVVIFSEVRRAECLLKFLMELLI